ncbi:MAG: hypothetical protein U0667_08335 [Chloroflexota bacterium]
MPDTRTYLPLLRGALGRGAVSPAPRLVDLRQVVRYHGPSVVAARARAEADQPVAVAAGFWPVGRGRADRKRSTPTWVVEYEFVAPATVIRVIRVSASDAADAFARDAVVMARAGYIAADERWRGTTFGVGQALALGSSMAYGWSGPGEIRVTYRHDPATAGRPDRAVVLASTAGTPRWWVLDA